MFRDQGNLIVGVDETSCLWVVVTTLQVIQAKVAVVVVATVTEWVEGCNIYGIQLDCALAVSVVNVFRNLGCTLVNGNDVTQQVLSICVQCAVTYKACQSFTVVQIGKLVGCNVSRVNICYFFLYQRRAVVGVFKPFYLYEYFTGLQYGCQ